MNCPDKEQLMLYVDGELDATESAEIKAHLHTCSNCQHEVELFQSDLETEALLRNKVNQAFQKRTVNKQIMTAIMAEPKPKAVKSNNVQTWWSSWLVKLMVPALAIAIALFVFLSGSPSQAPQNYNGKVYRISVLANNNQAECFVDGSLYTATNSFDVTAESFKKLEGNFLVNVVTVNELYSFNIDGKTSISFDLASMTPIFEDCKANISIINSDSANVKINGEKIKITRSKPFEAKVIEKEPAKTDIEVKKEEPKTQEEPVATLSVKIETNEEISIASETQVESLEETNLPEITGFGDESLTQEQIDDISVIDSSSAIEEEKGESASPFAGKKIKKY